MDAQTPGSDQPVEEYFAVEIFGHRSHVGRVMEIDRFGAKLMRIDVPRDGDFSKGYVSHFYGGGSIFSMTPCDLGYVQRANKGREPAGMLTFMPPLEGRRATDRHDPSFETEIDVVIDASTEEGDTGTQVDVIATNDTALAAVLHDAEIAPAAPNVITEEPHPEPPLGGKTFASLDAARKLTALGPFPQLDDIKPGDQLMADDAFTCIDEGEIIEVMEQKNDNGAVELWVPCRDGRHYLEGQRGDAGACVGFWKVPDAPPVPSEPVAAEADDEILF